MSEIVSKKEELEILSIDDFIEKNKAYNSVDGFAFPLASNILEYSLNKWKNLPSENKYMSLIPTLTHKPNDVNNEHYSYYVNTINELSGKDYNVYISKQKNIALNQVFFSKEYFPSDDDFLTTCEEVLNLPEDRWTIYKYLNDKSMYNLRYVPNKNSLINDCMNDSINLNYEEIDNITSNPNIGFDDIWGYRNKENNFSQQNYIKSVDLMMNILGGWENDGNRFRKAYQLYNAVENAKYNDFEDYLYENNNYYDDNDYYYDDDDDYPEDEEYNDNTKETELEETSSPYPVDLSFSLDLPPDYRETYYHEYFGFPEAETNLLHLFAQNQNEISDSAYKLCKIFGAQAKNFVNTYININDSEKTPARFFKIETRKHLSNSDILDNVPYYAEDIIEKDISQIMTRNKINALKLKNLSFSTAEQEAISKILSEQQKEHIIQKKRFIEDNKTQKELLKLINILPIDYSQEKFASFNKFMQKNFVYNLKDGTKKTRETSEIEKIVKIWPQLTLSQERMKYDEILNLASGSNYINGKAQEFIATAKINNLPKNLFDIAQQSYIRGAETPRTIPHNYSINKNDITLRFMDTKDPSVMFAGKGFSCQTITEAGAYPTLSSVEDPFSRALLIERNGKSVGLAWAWTNEETINGKKYNSMCIDNIELAAHAVSDVDDIMHGLKELSKKVADENNFKRVTLGAKALHYNPNSYFKATSSLKLPDKYINQSPNPSIKEKINYGDSARQVLVYENKLALPYPEDKKYIEEKVFLANRDEYTITNDERLGALAVGDAAYPWKAEFREEDKNSKFMMLCNMKKEIVGYALYSDVDRHIHDVAVHPDYAHYSKNLLFPLLNHMKEIGGTWKAETRESTSYALLKKLEERGTINLTEHKKSFMGIQGERLNVISINFNDNKTKTAELLNQKSRQYQK